MPQLHERNAATVAVSRKGGAGKCARQHKPAWICMHRFTCCCGTPVSCKGNRLAGTLTRQTCLLSTELWGGAYRWWQAADSPWQLLAVCYDLKAALASGDPESYMSRLPIHQDGSCNGLQHYAALGRDESGGRAVNLLPVDKPQVSPQAPYCPYSG